MPPSSTNNFFGVKVSKAGIPVNQASDKQLVYKDDFSTKTYFDLTNSRMLEGLLPDGTYGLWVSRPGANVTTATEDQLIFNSNRNLFKIVDSKTVSISHNHTATNSAQTTSVAHNQPQRPIILAYANNLVAPGVPGTPSYLMPFLYPAVSGGNLIISTYLYHETNNTNIVFTSWSANITVITTDIRYYILQETASA